jgi:hypothetical protein
MLDSVIQRMGYSGANKAASGALKERAERWASRQELLLDRRTSEYGRYRPLIISDKPDPQRQLLFGLLHHKNTLLLQIVCFRGFPVLP